uniref:Small ribosomal subunit protein mS33 n=1 Tax=Nomascus leucogenys TaxID=61853 RepID=A0A2I3HX55_NOMLE
MNSLNLIKYVLRMSHLSAWLFGEVTRPPDSKSTKVMKLFSELPLTLRFLGLYRDEHQDFMDEQKRLKKLHGKEKPKKGEGKRAAKRK